MTEIKVFCLHCGQHIQCEESCRGTQINCPSCNQSFLVPQVKRPTIQPLLQTITSPERETEPTPVPISGAGVTPLPQPANGKRLRIKPDYLAEAKNWDGEGIPEDWQSRSSRISEPEQEKPVKSFQLSGSSPLTTIIVSAALGGYNTYLLSYNGFWVIKSTEVMIWMSVQTLFALLCFASVIQQAGRRFNSMIGAGVIICVVGIAVFIGFKSIDPESMDLIRYENVVSRLSTAEDLAIAPLKQINDKSSDNEILTILRDVVIPSYESFYTQLESAHPQTSEVQALHRQYLDGAQSQLAGWRGMVQALKEQDVENFKAALKLRNSGEEQIKSFISLRQALDSKHGIVHEK